MSYHVGGGRIEMKNLQHSCGELPVQRVQADCARGLTFAKQGDGFNPESLHGPTGGRFGSAEVCRTGGLVHMKRLLRTIGESTAPDFQGASAI